MNIVRPTDFCREKRDARSEGRKSPGVRYVASSTLNFGFISVTSLMVVGIATGPAHAQQTGSPLQLPPVVVTAPANSGYGTQAQYKAGKADLGPLGDQLIQDTPQSITVVPEDLIVNQQARSVNDTLRYLPSVQVRDQQGLEVSRPQARGFQGTVVQNTRVDGLNIVGTTAIASEYLSGIEVLNGLAGSLYGPQTPAGVFNYILKRPTDTTLLRYIQSYDSDSIFTEQIDAGGRFGSDGKLGFRVNLLHGEGGGYVSGSNLNRTLLSAALDFHIDDDTVIEANYSFYETNTTGLPGSIVYNGGRSTILPPAIDPTRVGFGQPNAGADLITNLAVVKVKHRFNEDWSFEAGGLYEDAIRNLLGITNTLIDNNGNFTVTKNFNAVPHFTIGSNSAYLNGHFDWLGMGHDVTIGTNGFINGQYTYRNSIAVNLGSANLANPVILPTKPTPNNGGQFKSAELSVQSLITGDTIHFNDQLALQAVLSTSFFSSKSWSNRGVVTSNDSRDGALSPTVSLIYKPIPALTTYASFSTSVEQGEQAAAGTANVNEILAPYHDRQYEIGAKYSIFDNLLITLDGFRMSRPLANTDPVTNLFEVVGTQRNWGAELFLQGDVTPDVSVFGGLTYIDARLTGTGNPATDDKLVVGVPRFKGDFTVDYHPAFARGFAVTGTLHAESSRAATNTNNSIADAYATFDFGLRYTTELYSRPTTLRFQVINISDTQYFSSIADGNIVGSPGANTAYSGAPRTFQVSLEMDF
jgi:iron complex outermembrane receptor protein